MYAYFQSMEHSMEGANNVRYHKAAARLEEKRKLKPSAQVTGPELTRTIAGYVNPDHSTAMVREYIMPRENLSKSGCYGSKYSENG